MIRTYLKKRILVQDVGGAGFQTRRAYSRYSEDLKPGPNTRIGPKGFFEIGSGRVLPVLVLIVLLVTACASQPLPPPEWTYEKGAIEVQLKPDSNLNYFEGVPHTLLLCLYQLRDPNAFHQLLDDSDGIYKLLECGLFDSAAVTAKRIIVRPGKEMVLKIDRAAGAKYVAAVAGYYVLEKNRMTRLYEIPVVVEKKGFIKKSKLSKPGPLKIVIELGPSQIKS